MLDITPATARNFLDHLELPAIARGGFEGFEPTAKVDFDALKNQAIVVGADVVSFVKGVSAERRQDIVNSALLAQLVANNKVKNRSNVFEWYDAYFDVLTNLGWVIQDKGPTGFLA